MTRAFKTTMALLIASLVAACDVPGDFCDVVAGPVEFAPSTAAQIVRTDRAQAVSIDAQNAYWRRHCSRV